MVGADQEGNILGVAIGKNMPTLGGMSMEAVGAYIAALRKKQGWSQVAFADVLGVSEKALRQWEHGEHEPKLTVLHAIVFAVKGAWDDVAQLLREDATIDEGRRLAKLRSGALAFSDEERALITRLSPEQRRLVAEIARQMLREELDAEVQSAQPAVQPSAPARRRRAPKST